MILVDNQQFRDLDHDGVLSPYEDWRLPIAARVDDLLTRMTLAEKVGTMLHGTVQAVGSELATIGIGTGYDLDAAHAQINGAGVTSLITRLSLAPAEFASQNNALQEVAARGRLGIPLTLSSDPRNHSTALTGASVDAGAFSKWPGTLGLAAIGDAGLVRHFADVVRQEYRSVGIHMALSPQADLATEPRWPRIDGTFGNDPHLVRTLVGAYVEGMQGGTGGLHRESVATVVKHWVGYGAARDGFDGHNYYGRYAAFPGGRLQDHIDAFLDAFAAGVAGVMPTYNVLEDVVIDGVPLEQVAAGFSSQLLTDLLRGTYGYRGVILSDWGITRDLTESARTGNPPQTATELGTPWGVDHLTRAARYAKGIIAGIDQFGGESDPQPMLDALGEGLLSEARVDESVRRVLTQKFELGLFDAPFADPDTASRTVGKAEFSAAAAAAQRASVVVLERRDVGDAHHPLPADARVFLHGFDAAAFVAAGVEVVESLQLASIAVVGLRAPFETLHPGFFFGRRQHEGDLDFKADHPDLIALTRISDAVPTIVVAFLDRPAILTNIRDKAETLIVDFGVDAEAIVDVLTGAATAQGRLPLQLSRSMEAVLAQHVDVPNDDPDPLYPLFHRA